MEGTAARALEFAILTAARTEEVILPRSAEINKREKLWTAPAEHMKLKREHVVPLCERAMQLLDVASGGYLFPNPFHLDKHLSNMAMLMVLERMGYGHVTVHGFRSTFKDWCRDASVYSGAELRLVSQWYTLSAKNRLRYLRVERQELSTDIPAVGAEPTTRFRGALDW